MKANEAPEKIYINSSLEDRIWLIGKGDTSFIEYTRTDIFIEKATEWLRKNADNYTWYDEMEGESGMTDEFIDDFKKYLKGE